jgi:hypothetical protein
MRRGKFGVLFGLVLAAAPTSAAEYMFSYIASSGTISGRMAGTLQGDGNTLLLSAISAPRRNGTPGPDVVVVGSFRQLVTFDPIPASVTLDGSLMDFVACTPGTGCSEGFTFTYEGLLYPQARFYAGGFYGALLDGEVYNRANWSIAPFNPGAVPEPASWALLIAGFGLTGAALRRRRYQGKVLPV